MKYFFILKQEFVDNVPHIDFRNIYGIVNEEDLLKVIQSNKIHMYKKVPAFDAGSRVRLVSERPKGWNRYGQMDHYLDTIQTVAHVNSSTIVLAGGLNWLFRISDIATTIEY